MPGYLTLRIIIFHKNSIVCVFKDGYCMAMRLFKKFTSKQKNRLLNDMTKY